MICTVNSPCLSCTRRAVFQISAAPIPAETKRITTVMEGGLFSAPSPLAAGDSVRLVHQDDATDRALQVSKRSSEDSAGEVGETELHSRAPVRVAYRAMQKAAEEARETASKSFDASGFDTGVGPSSAAGALKINSNSKTIATSSRDNYSIPQDTKKWSKSYWVNHINSLNDAELLQLMLSRAVGTQHGSLPMAIYERMLNVLPPSSGGRKYKWSKEALGEAAKISQLRKSVKKQIKKVAFRAAATSASFLPPTSIQDIRHGSGEHTVSSSSSSPHAPLDRAASVSRDTSGLSQGVGASRTADALKLDVKSKGILKTTETKQRWEQKALGHLASIAEYSSLDDAALLKKILGRTHGGRRPLLPLSIYQRMLNVLPPPLPPVPHQLDQETVNVARMASVVRRGIVRQIKAISKAGDAPATAMSPSLPKSTRSPALARSSNSAAAAKKADGSLSAERSPLSLLADVAHQQSAKKQRHGLLSSSHQASTSTSSSTSDTQSFSDPSYSLMTISSNNAGKLCSSGCLIPRVLELHWSLDRQPRHQPFRLT